MGCDPKENKTYSYKLAYASSALSYYQKALELQPQDSVIRCNAALTALLLGHGSTMKELNQSAQAHYVLGAKYLNKAKREPEAAKSPSSYYGKALLEFKQAIDLNPTYHEALNGFAYTYWVFRLRWPQEDISNLG